MAWYWYPILVVFIFCAGAITMYLVMKNNPKFLDPKKMAKDRLQKLVNDAQVALKEKA